MSIAAADEAKTCGLGEESNKEWHPRASVPYGLLPKTHIAALQRLAGSQPAFTFAPCAERFRPCNASVSIALTGPNQRRTPAARSAVVNATR